MTLIRSKFVGGGAAPVGPSTDAQEAKPGSPVVAAERPWQAKKAGDAKGAPTGSTAVSADRAEAETVQTELRSQVQAALSENPVLARQQAAVQLLSSRRDELLASAKGMKAAQDAWTKEKGGFTSMGRLLAGVAVGIQEGSLSKVKEVAVDPTLGGDDRPYEQALAASTRTASAIQELASQVAQGKDISAHRGKDATIDEAIALLQGSPRSVEDVAKNRLSYLQRSLQTKDLASATQDYRRVMQTYLATSVGGEGVGAKAGRPTMAGALNALVVSGALGDAGLVALPGDAAALTDALSTLHRSYTASKKTFLEKHPDAKEAMEALSEALGKRTLKKALAEEDVRLAGLADKPELRGLAAAAREAQRGWKGLQAELEPGFLQSSWTVVRDAVNDPATLAMMAVTGGAGALVGAGAGVLGTTVVTAADLGMMARAGTLSGRALGMWSAGTTVEGGLFHVGMNGFNLARGKDEFATWGAADFASSALLFHTLGGVTANAMKRVAPTTALGKEAFQARLMAEQAGAMTLYSLGEAKLRHGQDLSAMELLHHNLGFLISMRMLGTAKGAFRKTPEATQQKLFQLESEVGRLATKYELEPTPENAARAYDVYRQYSELLTKTQQQYVSKGITEKQQQLVQTKVRDVSAAEFERIVDTWKDSALGEARAEARRAPDEDAAYAEKSAAIEARHQTLREGSVAFYDPLTGQTLVNREAGGVARDAVLRHEFSHQVFNSLPEAQRSQLVKTLQDKGVAVKDPAALDELLAQWNGRDVAAPVPSALEPLHAALTSLDAKTQRPLADVYELDLGAMELPALQASLGGKSVRTTSGARAPLPWGVPEILRDSSRWKRRSRAEVDSPAT